MVLDELSSDVQHIIMGIIFIIPIILGGYALYKVRFDKTQHGQMLFDDYLRMNGFEDISLTVREQYDSLPAPDRHYLSSQYWELRREDEELIEGGKNG